LSADTSLKAAILAFKKHMRFEGFSRHTIQAFSSDLNLLGRYLGIGQAIGQVTLKNLNDFLNWMLNERDVPCSPKTYARRVTTLKVFFKWLHGGGILTVDPAAAVVQRSVRSPLPIILSRQEIDRLLEAADHVRHGVEGKAGDARPLLLLELLLQTGIKKGEAMDIVPNHIDRTDPETPILFVRYRNPARRYKERKIPLQAGWLPILDEYLAQYKPNDTLFTCTPRNLEYVLRDLEEMTGLNKPVSFECLRWTSAVRSYVQGVDPDLLRERMGLSPVTWRETLSKIKRLAHSPGA
jgi:integrase/recombinase XerD